MQKASNLIGKEVISLYEAQSLGTVVSLVPDSNLRSIKYLCVFHDDNDEDLRRYIPLTSAENLSADVITVKNMSAIIDLTDADVPSTYPANLPVYSHCGKLLGKVTDLTLNGTAVEEIIAEEFSFSPQKILSHSDKLIIVNCSERKIKLVPPREKAARAYAKADNPPALRLQEDADKTIEAENPDVVETNAAEHEQSGEGYSFLLGKTITRAITLGESEQPLKEGDVVTPRALESAKRHGKLVQLALYSR